MRKQNDIIEGVGGLSGAVVGISLIDKALVVPYVPSVVSVVLGGVIVVGLVYYFTKKFI